jgi:hypothetical protein
MAEEPTSDKIARSARGEDKPMDARRPSIPFALVWGSYPIILIVALLVILAVFWMTRGE